MGSLVILFFHIIAGSIWIGGQITLAFIVPAIREQRVLVTKVARRFAVLAWTAYGALLITGVIELAVSGYWGPGLWSTGNGRNLILKFALVLISGAAAALHSLIQGPKLRNRLDRKAFAASTGLLGSATLFSALGAAWLGVLAAHS